MKPLDRVLLKPEQIQDLHEEKSQIDAALAPTNPFRSKISKPQLMHQRKKSIDKQLDDYAATPLEGFEKDKLNNLEKELRAAWTTGMPTEEEMRKNPPGMVDRHRKWEKLNKKIIGQWKNVRRQLEPDSDDKDLANIERYRPSGVMDRLVAGAQISGAMNYRAIPQENWDQAFEGKKPENTALEQAKRVRREMSEEAKDRARANLARARELKKQQAEQTQATEAEPALSEA
jgi:hypothetical protein